MDRFTKIYIIHLLGLMGVGAGFRLLLGFFGDLDMPLMATHMFYLLNKEERDRTTDIYSNPKGRASSPRGNDLQRMC